MNQTANRRTPRNAARARTTAKLTWAVAGTLATLTLAAASASQPTNRGRSGNRPQSQPATQPSTQPATQPTTPAATPGTQPATPAATPAEQPEPTVGPLITAGRTREWTLTAGVGVRAYEDPGIDYPDTAPTQDRMPTIEVFNFDNMTLVWPVVPSSASSELAITTPQGEEPVLTEFSLRVNDIDATRLEEFSHEILTSTASGKPYHSGTWLALLKLGRGISAREVTFEFKIPTRSWETRYDERAARQIAWPEGPWPADAASTLTPMALLDIAPDGRQTLANGTVRSLLAQWTDNKDPKSIPPAVLAKWLAGQVMQHVQISGNGLAATRNGLLEGVSLQTPEQTARSGVGSEFDMVMLLTAVYRLAGLPARVVVGYDTEADTRDDPAFLGRRGSSGDLCAWVEFCLYDEPSNTVNWVPVDIVRLRSKGNRLPDNYLDAPMRYFGSHDELDDVVPFAFQFFPPTTVRSYGSPGFWGWFVTPAAPGRAWQSIHIDATTTPRRGG